MSEPETPDGTEPEASSPTPEAPEGGAPESAPQPKEGEPTEAKPTVGEPITSVEPSTGAEPGHPKEYGSESAKESWSEHDKRFLGIKLHNWIFVGMVLGILLGLGTYSLDPFDKVLLSEAREGQTELRGHVRHLEDEQVYVVMSPEGLESRVPAAQVKSVERAADRPGGRWHKTLLWWFNLFGRTLFLGALKMIVAPLILASIVAGIVSLTGLDQLKQIGFKTIGYYLVTTTVAVTIGLVVVLTLRPGKKESSQKLRVQRQAKLDQRADAYRAERKREAYEQIVTPAFQAFADKERGPGAVALDLSQSTDPAVAALAKGYRAQSQAEPYERGPATPAFRSWLDAVEAREAGVGHEGARMRKLTKARGQSPGDVFVSGVVKPMLTNPFYSLANSKSLGIIFFAVLLGVAIVVVGGRARVVADFFVGFNEVIIWITTKLMAFAPFCVMCLVAGLVGEKGPAVFSTLAWYCLAVVGGILLHVAFLFGVAKTLGGCSPLRLWAGLREALMIAFTTRSSAATLPVTMRCVTDNLGVTPRVANFALPVGATMNMDGTALYEGVAVIFLIQIFGGLVDAPFELTMAVTLVIFVTAVLASVGAAAVPDAGLVTMVLVAEAVGLPVYYIPLIFAVDAFLDMFRTTTNVLGDSVGALVVHRMEVGTPAGT